MPYLDAASASSWPELQISRLGNRLRRADRVRIAAAASRVCLSRTSRFCRQRVKKGPENRISVVADKVAARGANPPMIDPLTARSAVGRRARPQPFARCHRALVRWWRAPARARATVPPSRCPARPQGCPLVRAGGHRAVPARGSGRGVKPVTAWGGADLTWRGESRVDACGPGREASPPRRPAAGPSAPSATVRDPAPGPACPPLRQDRAAHRATRPRQRGPSSFPVSRQIRATVRRGRPGGGRT